MTSREFTWTGVTHRFTSGLFSWHCDIHKRVCSPGTPVIDGDLLQLAARDASLDDAAFVVLARTVEGHPILATPQHDRSATHLQAA